MEKISKKELVAAVAANTGMTKVDVEKVVNGLFDVIRDTLCDGTAVTIPDVCVLKIIEVKARNFRNPKSGELVMKPARRKIKLTTAKAMRAYFNGEEAVSEAE